MIELSGLNKSFGTNQVLRNLNLSVKQGEFYSLLGPNGAGKSTTINIIAQLLRPDEGKVMVNGFDASTQVLKIKALLGVVPQEIALYEELTAWENLMFWGQLNGVSRSGINERGKKILTKFGLYERKDEKIKTYSGGMKRRINIAVALLHNPEVILMDEPTVGIDPQSRNNIYEFMESLKSEGKTIIYTTHYMEEAERFSDRIGVMDNGRLVTEGTLSEIKESVKLPEHIVVEIEGESTTVTEKLIAQGMKAEMNDGKLLIATTNFKSDLKNLVLILHENNAEIQHLEKREVDLETIFLKLTGKNLRD